MSGLQPDVDSVRIVYYVFFAPDPHRHGAGIGRQVAAAARAPLAHHGGGDGAARGGRARAAAQG